MKDIIFEKLSSIQNEYLELLESIIPDIDKPWEDTIDRINLFWLQRKKTIIFAMRNYFPPQKTFLFTAATFLDYDAKEHFPFVVCDGVRIVDDSVCTYGNVVGKMEGETINKTIKEQLMFAIEDNIKVLKNCAQYLYILPISFLSDDNLDIIAKSSEDVFLKLFEPKFDTLRDYFQCISSVEDLEKSLKPGIQQSLMFFSGDDRNLNLSERINNYIEDSQLSINLKGSPISKIFLSAVYAPIVQSLKILFLCAQYNIIPYLRYDVAFHNFSTILSNYPDETQRKIIEDKVYTCFLIYKAFDLDSVKLDEFQVFAENLRNTNIFEQVFEKINTRTSQTRVSEIGDFAHQQLEYIIGLK